MKRSLGMIGIAVALTTASSARADHAEELAAQTLYDKALELMKAGKAASACPLLAESQRLDPAVGTQYWLAECFEKTGRTVAAWQLYTEVTEASKKSGRKDREEKAHDRAEAVWKLLPRLIITVPPELATVEGLAVTCDGKSVPAKEWNHESPLDAGERTIEAQAPGKKPWRGTVTARAGATEEVRVPVLEAPAVIGPAASQEAPRQAIGVVEPPSKGTNKVVVISGAAGAFVALGVGVGFAVASSAKSSQFDARKSECKDGQHGGIYYSCPEDLHAIDASRVTFANVAGYSFIAAGLIGAGTLTYALLGGASKSKSRPVAAVVIMPGMVAGTASIRW